MDLVSFRIFPDFIASIISKSRAKTSVVLVALLYLDRCRKLFDAKAFKQLWLKERLFVVAMVLAHKVSNVSTLRACQFIENNQYLEDRQRPAAQWARLAGILSAGEIGVAERTFLQMMNWDLSVPVDYFVGHANPPV